MKAIILAGGKGTRLHSVVSDVPKPMAPVSSHPFLEILISNFIRKGIDEIVLSVGYKREVIMNYFSDSYKGVPISYAIEEAPLGTGGAVINALKKISNKEDIFIFNGDTFLDFEPLEMMDQYRKSKADVGIALKEMQDCGRYGRVLLNKTGVDITNFTEKGESVEGVINAGVYLLHPAFLERFSFDEQFSLENDCFVKYLQDITFHPFIVDSYFIDIGVPEDYIRAQVELLSYC